MKRLLFIVALVLCGRGYAYASCTESPAGTWNPTDWASVQTCHDNAGFDDGDIILLPSGTLTGGTAIVFDGSKVVVLKGASCTLDGNSRATACATKIQDSTTSTLLTWTLKSCSGCGLVNRITQLEFSDNGRGGVGQTIQINGQASTGAQDDRRLRIDHTVFGDLDTGSQALLFTGGVYGVMDHSTVNTTTFIWSRFYNPTSYAFADKRWSEDLSFAGSPSKTGWGSAQFFYIENNNITANVITDGDSGNRVAGRFNTISQGYFDAHGQDGATGRAQRAMEVYKNTGTVNGVSPYFSNMHGGTSFVWGNDIAGISGSPAISSYGQYRSLQQTNGVPIADGTIPMDVNSGSNPFASCTVSAVGGSSPNQTVQCSGVTWTANQWSGYRIHVQGCIPADVSQCGALIASNTGNGDTPANTLTLTMLQVGWTVNVAVSNTIDINAIVSVYDQVGRAGGNLGTRVSIGFGNLDHVGAVAVVHAAGHGLSGGEKVWIENCSGSPNGAYYNGVWTIALGDDGGNDTTNYFHYTMGGNPGVGGGSVFAGNWTKLLWTTSNDQESDPAYQWLNTDGASGNLLTTGATQNIVQNTHFFDYEPAKTFDGTIASNRSSIGVGVIGSRPATCTTGVAYWATDEGTWDSVHAGNDGRLYRCTATNTWTLWYTPYTYPHPLIGGADTTVPTPGNSGALTTSNITTTSLTLNWTEGTDDTSSQPALVYEVRRSSTNNIDTVSNAEANGTIAQAYTADISSANLFGLSASTTYWFNVIVKDEAGNKAAYTQKSETTAAAAVTVEGGASIRLRIRGPQLN